MRNNRYIKILVLISLMALFYQANAFEKKPIITSDEKFWDFGFVPFDYELVHYYEIKNEGNVNLYITALGTSCDCTHARALDTLIPPGQSTKIKVTFGTTNYYGKNTRTVSVSSNDPDTPVYTLEFLSLIGALPKTVEAVPNALFFLPGHKEKEIKLVNKTGKEIKTKIYREEPDSIFTISDTEMTIEPDKPAILKVIPKGTLNPATYQTSFTVDFLTDPPMRITIPVKIVRY